MLFCFYVKKLYFCRFYKIRVLSVFPYEEILPAHYIYPVVYQRFCARSCDY